MLFDPRVAPGVVVAPGLWIQVYGAVIEGGDTQVAFKVYAFVTRVGVGLLVAGYAGGGGGEPAFVAEGDHVVAIELFDVGGDAFGPVVDDVRGAAGAARFVAQFPGEDCCGGFVALDDEFDVFLVGGLGGDVGVEALVGAAVDVGVGYDAAQVVEVVEKGEDQFDAVLFGGGDGVVEAGDAVAGVVVEVLAAAVEGLEVDVRLCGGVVGAAEGPDAGDFVARLWRV